jgi:type II secretory pathway pseudopilin PulG
MKVKNKAFTILEFIVVVAIVTMLISSVLYNYSSFNDKLALSTAAREMVMSIRQTQTYGINVREATTGGGDFTRSYGIYFNPTASPSAYYIFIDRNNDGRYNDSLGACTGTECVEKVSLRDYVTITSLGKTGSNCPTTNVPPAYTLEAIFTRPNPDAVINFRDSSGNIICAATSYLRQNGLVNLTSKKGATMTISLDPTGQVYIQ